MEEPTQHSKVRSASEEALWRLYVSAREASVREKLISLHLETAKKIAAYLYSQRPDNTIDFADYLQYARVGLIEAIDRFDPDVKASFETFASYRIRGAILNGVRRYTEKSSQSAYRRDVLRERAESMQEDSDESSSDHAFEDLVDTTIGLALGYILEDSSLWSAEQTDHASDPYRSLELKRLRERIALIVEVLPDRERLIVRYHYFEHMEFNMIAEILGVSKGRVSQMHARALRLIRDAFEGVEYFQRSY